MESHQNITVMDKDIPILTLIINNIISTSIRHHLPKLLFIPIHPVQLHLVIMVGIMVVILGILCISRVRVRPDRDKGRQDKDRDRDSRHHRVLGMGIVGRE
jgi:hypothetical protein